MTEQEINEQIKINEETRQFIEPPEYEIPFGMTEQEYAEYIDRLADKTDEELMEEQESEMAWFAIQDIVNDAEKLSSEHMEYLIQTLTFKHKYRGVDIYTAIRLNLENNGEKTLIEEKLILMEKTLNQLLSDGMNKDKALFKVLKEPTEVYKRHLSVVEFEREFNISKSKQQQLRGRGMPIVPRKSNDGKIVYEYKEVKRWIENNGI